MCDNKKNNNSNVSTRLAGAAILMVAVTGGAALADTPSAANDRVVTIKNTTNEPLELGTPEWPKGFSRGARIEGECRKERRIPAGGECQLPIRFEPSQVGSYSGDVVISVQDGKLPSVVIHVTGTGIAATQSEGVRVTERGNSERGDSKRGDSEWGNR